MLPLFSVRGYTAPDPLDRAPEVTAISLTVLVAGVIAALWLYVQSAILGIVTYRSACVFWVGVAVCGIAGGALLAILRKSSSLFFSLLIAGVGVLTDIQLQTHFRDVPWRAANAWWDYQPNNPIGGLALPWRFLAAWILAALVLGPLALWIARLIAGAIYPADLAKDPPTMQQQAELFRDAWSLEVVDKPQRDLAFWYLRVIGLGYAAYALFLLIGLLGVAVWPAPIARVLRMTYENPALAIETFGKITLMSLLALIGAYNRNVRWYATLVLAIGHLFSGGSSLFFYLVGPDDGPHRRELLLSATIDAVLIIGFIIILIVFWNTKARFKPEKEFPDFFSLPDTLNRWLYKILGSSITLLIILVFIVRLFPGEVKAVDHFSNTLGEIYEKLAIVFGYPDPQLGNAIGLMAALATLSFLLVRRIALRDYLVVALGFALSVGVIGNAFWSLIGPLNGHGIMTPSGVPAFVDWYFVLAAVLCGIALALVLGLRKMYYDIDFMITSLNPSSARNVAALNEALFAGTMDDSATVMGRLDRHVAGIRGRKRGLLNFPFWLVEGLFTPIYGLHPPFSTMSADEGRYFLRKKLLRPPHERAISFIPLLAELSFQIGTAVHALITLARFSYVEGWMKTGYVLPDARDRLQRDHATAPPPMNAPAELPKDPKSPLNDKQLDPPGKPLLVAPRVSTTVRQSPVPDEVDYVVVGSGAGGACLAYRLACETKDPSRILILDRGPRYMPPQDFNDDEMEMLRKLYKEGGLQSTKRFDLIVLQGECVGGTTVINNAVCFEMPQPVRDLWQGEFDIDLSNLDAEYNDVAQEIEIQTIGEDAINQRVKKHFLDGVEGFNTSVDPAMRLKHETLRANQRGMIGDGCDNLGNKRLRKRSMLETYLPWSEARGAMIIPDTSGVRFSTGPGGRRAESVLVRNNAGGMKSIKVRKGVIVAGGVIASSHFLMRSKVKGNVGRWMSCNFAFPAAFEFPDVLDAFDGTQMTIGALDPKNRAVFETFFATPATFGVALPFHFNRLDSLLTNYRNLMNFGTLVGSEPNGIVEKTADPLTGRPFTWEIGDEDRSRIKFAFSTLLEMGLRAGATRAILPTIPGLEIPMTRANVDEFNKAIKDYRLRMSDARLTTAHPQGGNRMAGDKSPHAAERVVDGKFRVSGYDNVFVADASLFPTGITVNPQWTIMAMASLAAKSVLKECE